LRALFAVVFGTLLSTCTTSPTLLEQIIEEGQLHVITRNSPTTYYFGPSSPRGIEYELMRGFAEYLGVSLNVEIADQIWQILPAVATGDADIAAAGLTTSGSSEVVFGPEYETSEQQVVYRRGGRRASALEDLLGARIEVPSDSAFARTLEIARRDFPALKWQEDHEATVEELVARVGRGEIDFTIVDSTMYDFLRQYHPETNVAFSIGRPQSIAWVLPKGADDLREAVAAYFAEIRATGALDRILGRYYFATDEFDYVGARAFVRHVRTRLPRYEDYFREAAAATGFDWRLLAAIAYQESHWNPDAVSPTGVRGMMMLTEHSARLVDVADRHDPRDSILGGAHYLQRMIGKLPDRIPAEDRLWMAMAAYNIGFGHLEDARIITQTTGADPDSWDAVRDHLPLLSDEKWFSRVRRGYARGDVPVEYVDNVRRYNEILHWLLDDDEFAPETEAFASPGQATASTWSGVNALP